MSERSTEHVTFSVERSYTASPAQVFNAWVDPAAKADWFIGPTEFVTGGHTLDFKVGGREHFSISKPDGPSYVYEARYQDIVADRRIVYTYEMRCDGTRISVSLATAEILPADDKTWLIYTEQVVFLDGGDKLEYREQGMRTLLENLAETLQRGTAQ